MDFVPVYHGLHPDDAVHTLTLLPDDTHGDMGIGQGALQILRKGGQTDMEDITPAVSHTHTNHWDCLLLVDEEKKPHHAYTRSVEFINLIFNS